MRALIVEDNPVNYMVMRNQLIKFGINSHVCTHGNEAIDHCTTVGMPDLILLDGYMPEMDGIAFLKWIRNYPGGNTPYIVFCSCSFDKIDIDEAVRLGADVHYSKPIAHAALVSCIAQAKERKKQLQLAQNHG